MKKKIAVDMLLNIFATAIPICVLQLLLLPALSRYMGGDEYGLLVTILALLNLIPSTFGNVLNNIRLIEGKKGEDTQANFNVLLLVMAGINLVIMCVLTSIYEKEITAYSLILIMIVSLLLLFREYFLVAFRIKLNYINIVISNLIMVAGYFLGFLLFRVTGRWQYMYLLGYAISLFFIILNSDLWKEPLSISSSFKRISGQTALLTVANFLGRITTYADKLLIFPILGGTVVSIYYAATLFGKVVSMTINPISSVMLSYLSKSSKKNDNTFRMAFIIASFVCVIGYFVCVAISKPVLRLLYPQFVDLSIRYIWITTGTMVLTALTAIVNPFVLKFYDMKWQIVINGIYVAIYIGLSILLLNIWGLAGFCTGALIAAFLKLGFMLNIYMKQKEKEA